MSLQYQGKQVEELIYNLAYIEFQIYFPYFRYSYSLPKPVKVLPCMFWAPHGCLQNFAIREGEGKAVEPLVVSKMNVAENTNSLKRKNLLCCNLGWSWCRIINVRWSNRMLPCVQHICTCCASRLSMPWMLLGTVVSQPNWSSVC